MKEKFKFFCSKVLAWIKILFPLLRKKDGFQNPEIEDKDASKPLVDNIISTDSIYLEKGDCASDPQKKSLSLDEIIALLPEGALAELVKERAEDLKYFRPSLAKWALASVDFLDELRIMNDSYSESESVIINQLSEKLHRELIEADCEMISDLEWNPSKQRAISIRRNLPVGETPRIVKLGVSGLIVQGELIRKQEVSLEMATFNN